MDGVLTCVGCAHALAAGDRFCESCGTPVPVTATVLPPAPNLPAPLPPAPLPPAPNLPAPLPPAPLPPAPLAPDSLSLDPLPAAPSAPDPLPPVAAWRAGPADHARTAAPSAVPAPALPLAFEPGPSPAPELPTHLALQWDPAVGQQPARGMRRALVVPLVMLLVGAAVVVGIVWSRSTASSTTASGAATAAPSAEGTDEAPYSPTSQGTSSDAPTGTWMRRASAAAPKTSPDNVDSAGRPTTYRAGNMLDGDPTTTWRMDGDGSGELITFRLDRPLPVSTVGLVNGYAKVDPGTGEDRYSQGRRITRVTWQLGEQVVEQRPRDGVRGLQQIDFPPVTTDVVYLLIERTTAPGAEGFDRTAISDVLIANP